MIINLFNKNYKSENDNGIEISTLMKINTFLIINLNLQNEIPYPSVI